MSARHATFPTDLGTCAIRWTDAGVSGFLLPEAQEADLDSAMARRWPGERRPAPEGAAAEASAAVTRLMSGERVDLRFVPLDLPDVEPFARQVYDLTIAIGPGQTRTYGEVAADLGGIGLARAVGVALSRNPIPVIVPCHRVLGRDGKLTGFSAPGGTTTKRRLLLIEGAASVTPDLFDGL